MPAPKMETISPGASGPGSRWLHHNSQVVATLQREALPVSACEHDGCRHQRSTRLFESTASPAGHEKGRGGWSAIARRACSAGARNRLNDPLR